ncbi:glycosyltransferase [Vibrio fluvialis]|nr:glycosyltransferase [Vibrio fluvialis]
MKRILYISTSYYASKAPNYIQVSNTVSALNSENLCFCIFKSEKDNVLTKNHLLIKAKRNRWSNFNYILKCVIYALYNGGKYDYIYTRNIFIAVLLSFFCKNKIGYESHSGFTSKIDKIFHRVFFTKKNARVFVISEALRCLYGSMIAKEKIFLVRDSHNFDIVPFEQRLINKQTGKIKIGYFGSIKKQKGLDYLVYIDNYISTVENLELYIYTKDLECKKEFNNCKFFGYCEHDKIQQKMQEMDLCLLFVVPQDDKRDISNYTSPLKLYEYAAAGVPILCSDLPILREAATEQEVIFVKNNVKEIESFLLNIHSFDFKSYRINSIALAENNSYEKRAKRIILSME